MIKLKFKDAGEMQLVLSAFGFVPIAKGGGVVTPAQFSSALDRGTGPEILDIPPVGDLGEGTEHSPAYELNGVSKAEYEAVRDFRLYGFWPSPKFEPPGQIIAGGDVCDGLPMSVVEVEVVQALRKAIQEDYRLEYGPLKLDPEAQIGSLSYATAKAYFCVTTGDLTAKASPFEDAPAPAPELVEDMACSPADDLVWIEGDPQGPISGAPEAVEPSGAADEPDEDLSPL